MASLTLSEIDNATKRFSLKFHLPEEIPVGKTVQLYIVGKRKNIKSFLSYIKRFKTGPFCYVFIECRYIFIAKMHSALLRKEVRT